MDGVCELVPKWLTWFEYVGSAINTDRTIGIAPENFLAAVT